MFIDESYFKGPLTIAQLSEKAVRDNLKDVIDRWESKILEAALGYDFYLALKTAMDELGSDDVLSSRWTELLDGTAFTNGSGTRKSFRGLRTALAGFIFYEYEKDLHYQTVGIGVVKSKSENSTPGNPAGKLAEAYNNAAREMDTLWDFLQVRTGETPNVYPEYKPDQVNNVMYWSWDYPFSLYSRNYMNPIF